jgi:hypothetical protein
VGSVRVSRGLAPSTFTSSGWCRRDRGERRRGGGRGCAAIYCRTRPPGISLLTGRKQGIRPTSSLAGRSATESRSRNQRLSASLKSAMTEADWRIAERTIKPVDMPFDHGPRGAGPPPPSGKVREIGRNLKHDRLDTRRAKPLILSGESSLPPAKAETSSLPKTAW